MLVVKDFFSFLLSFIGLVSRKTEYKINLWFSCILIKWLDLHKIVKAFDRLNIFARCWRMEINKHAEDWHWVNDWLNYALPQRLSMLLCSSEKEISLWNCIVFLSIRVIWSKEQGHHLVGHFIKQPIHLIRKIRTLITEVNSYFCWRTVSM